MSHPRVGRVEAGAGVEGWSSTIGGQQLVTMASRDPLQWAGLMQLPLPLRWRFPHLVLYRQ